MDPNEIQDPAEVLDNEAVTPETNEPAPTVSPEDLEIYSLGLAAKAGWAPKAPEVEAVIPCFEGTNTPLPSNHENLDEDVLQAMREIAIANERNTKALLEAQQNGFIQSMAPVMRENAINQIASSVKGVDRNDAAAIAEIVKKATGQEIAGNLTPESARLFGLAAKGLASERPAPPVGDTVHGTGAPPKDSADLTDAYAAYKSLYGREPSDFIKAEIAADLAGSK